MRGSKVISIVAVLGALAVAQVSVDAAWAAKKPHEKHEKHAKKEKKEKHAKKEKKEKKEDKKEDKKDEKDRRDTNKCPGWLSKGCSPGACRCPVGPDEKDIKKAAEEAKKKAEEEAKKKAKDKEKKPKKAAAKEKKPTKAKEKDKKPQKAESGWSTQTRNGVGLARRMPSSSSPLTSFVIRYDKLMCSIAGRKLNAGCCDLSMFDAHLAAGAETRMGSMVAGVSEKAVHNITLSAGEVPDLDSNLIDRLVHHRTKHLSALGDPIPREVTLQVASR